VAGVVTTTLTQPVAPREINSTEKILSELQAVYDQFVVFPSPEARDAVVLWTAHAHAFTAFDSTPRLSLCSAEPGSGKTRVLELIEQLCPNPINAVYATPGVLWRSIEHHHPTILLDEVDTVFGRNGSSSSHRHLRGILDAGHRRGATVPRCVGSEDVKLFHVFAPVAMAGLGRLPDTLASRSVTITMRKPRRDEKISPFRLRFVIKWLHRTRDDLIEWSGKVAKQLTVALPELPVKDRDADVWEPLVSIADLAGIESEWPLRARKACSLLVAQAKDRPLSVGVKLLADLKAYFAASGTENVHSATLLDHLWSLDNGWSPDTFTARVLAATLVQYDVRPVKLRIGKRLANGYRKADLTDAFERYLESHASNESAENESDKS
jgi:hypothetical protein